MPPLLADFIYNRVCKLKCEKSLTLPLLEEYDIETAEDIQDRFVAFSTVNP